MTDIDLSAAVYNIHMTRNDGLRIHATLPLDLTGHTVTAHFRTTPDSTEYTEFTVDVIDAPTGVVEATLARVPREGFYDLQVTKDGVPRTYMAGAITQAPDVTRP